MKSILVNNQSYKVKQIKEIKKSHIILLCVAHNEFYKIKNKNYFEKKFI